MGPLTRLQGTWQSPASPNQGWNVIAVPGPAGDGFVLEIIPYQETLTFSPVVVAGNRGPFVGGNETVQSIVGLLYEQVITSVCDNAPCKQRGFPSGTQIHAETGLFLNLTNQGAGFGIARLSTIPHGNSLLALGNSSQTNNPGTGFIPDNSTLPHPNPNPGLDGYFDRYGPPFLFPNFDTGNPNAFLRTAISAQSFSSLTTLEFSTANATGGVLNIPFIKSNIDTTQVDATFWIEELTGGGLQLQYSQNINLVFPPTGSKVPVNWPHVTVNTLRPR
ncbi:MAG: hypothetical protein IH605_06530 [Burkholderiales bacterium]|nr:hypothetical protein [Burkholderiales bacterium]